MKRVKVDVRVTVADSLSNTLVRLYKDAVAANPDGVLLAHAEFSLTAKS